jgi:hypothetical protein
MNSGQNQNKQNTTNSTRMDLENLQKKYSNLIAQYKSAVYEYTNFLSQQASNPDKKPTFTAIKGYAVIGSKRIGFNPSLKLQECEASCAKLSNCTGATFITPKGHNLGCILNSGDTRIVRDRPEIYAIIPKTKELLLNMENINKELIETNEQIRIKIKNAEPEINANRLETSSKTQEFMNTYKDLTAEREKILNLLRQYETLDSVDDENQIIINQNYYSYFLLCILAFAVIFLLYRVSFPPRQTFMPTTSFMSTPFTPNVQYGGILGINAYFIVFVLILMTIGIHYYFKYFP